MIAQLFPGAVLVIMVLLFPTLYRAFVGPTTADRLIAVNAIATKAIVLIVLLSIVTGQSLFLDIAFVYAMIGFIATIAITRFIERGHL